MRFESKWLVMLRWSGVKSFHDTNAYCREE